MVVIGGEIQRRHHGAARGIGAEGIKVALGWGLQLVPWAAMAVTAIVPGGVDIKRHTDAAVSTTHDIPGFGYADVGSCGHGDGG